MSQIEEHLHTQKVDKAASNPMRSMANLFLPAEPEAAFKSAFLGSSSLMGNPTRHIVRPVMQDTALKNWIPFLPRPDYLDGTYAGDAGFDPLGLVTRNKIGPVEAWWWDIKIGGTKTSEQRLKFLREAELKHARLAMLAVVGWPLSEMLQGSLPALTQNPEASALMETAGRAPSVLNGGLGQAAPVLGLALLLSTYLEIKSFDKILGWGNDGAPGNFGFDPLGLYEVFDQLTPSPSWEQQDDPEFMESFRAANRRKMEESELMNGRLAMLGITGFAFQEALSGIPVIEQTPEFFVPFFFLPQFNQF